MAPPDSVLNAAMVQTGGTNFCNGTINVFYASLVPPAGPGIYLLSNGVLYATGVVSSGGGGNFSQWGGSQTNAGISVTGAHNGWLGRRVRSFTRGGGTVCTPWIAIAL